MIFGGGGGGGLRSYGCIHTPYGKRGAVSELRIQLLIHVEDGYFRPCWASWFIIRLGFIEYSLIECSAKHPDYPLVNQHSYGKSLFSSWVNPLFQWPFSIAM